MAGILHISNSPRYTSLAVTVTVWTFLCSLKEIIASYTILCVCVPPVGSSLMDKLINLPSEREKKKKRLFNKAASC